MGKSRWATSYKEIYDHYSYDSLDYIIDMISGFYFSQKELSQNVTIVGAAEQRKQQMLRFEIIAKYCHYAEALGAFIQGYRSNRGFKDRESRVLSSLGRYKVKDIDGEYKLLIGGSKRSLGRVQKNLLTNIFGYYRITVPKYVNEARNSLLNIKGLLKEIYGVYQFYKDSYNSYKHGYRLWFARDQGTNLDITVYIPTVRKRKRRTHVPSDDDSISSVLQCAKYCRQVFGILIENDRRLSEARRMKLSTGVEISFLKRKNDKFVIKKHLC